MNPCMDVGMPAMDPLDKTELKIMSYNIHSGIGTDGVRSYQRIGEYLAQRNIDVALIQEMDTLFHDGSRQQNPVSELCGDHFQQLVASPALVGKNESQWYGNAILTRLPVLEERSVDVSQAGFQPRNIQEVILQTACGPLQIINTHKGLKRYERRRQLALLGDHIRSRAGGQAELRLVPMIVAGDFNEWQFFTRTFSDLNKLLAAHPVACSFPSRFPMFKLDRVWSNPKNMIRSARIIRSKVTRVLSDHLPLEIVIELP